MNFFFGGIFGCQFSTETSTRIHDFKSLVTMGPWVNHSKPPRRDSFPAFDVIHLGKCSRKILQEPKDQDTVPTLNLGMQYEN